MWCCKTNLIWWRKEFPVVRSLLSKSISHKIEYFAYSATNRILLWSNVFHFFADWCAQLFVLRMNKNTATTWKVKIKVKYQWVYWILTESRLKVTHYFLLLWKPNKHFLSLFWSMIVNTIGKCSSDMSFISYSNHHHHRLEKWLFVLFLWIVRLT